MKNSYKGSSMEDTVENAVLWSISVINFIRLFPVAQFFKVIQLEDVKWSWRKATILLYYNQE